MKPLYYAHCDPNGDGWMVFDRTTRALAEVNGTRHQNVPGEDIDELVDMLNAVEARRHTVKRKAWQLRFRIQRDRYYARRDADSGSWSVWDRTKGQNAEVSGSSSTELSAEDADDLADMLNRIEARRA